MQTLQVIKTLWSCALCCAWSETWFACMNSVNICHTKLEGLSSMLMGLRCAYVSFHIQRERDTNFCILISRNECHFLFVVSQRDKNCQHRKKNAFFHSFSLLLTPMLRGFFIHVPYFLLVIFRQCSSLFFLPFIYHSLNFAWIKRICKIIYRCKSIIGLTYRRGIFVMRWKQLKREEKNCAMINIFFSSFAFEQGNRLIFSSTEYLFAFFW